VAVHLARRGVETYLPVIPRRSQWHDRQKTILWPLYPGYVFVRLSDREFSQVTDLPGVASLVGNEGKPSPIDPVDLDNVRRIEALLEESGEIPVSEPLVEEGERVFVESGQLSGMRGVVLQRRGSGRVLIQVGLKTIGQGVKLEVDARQLRSLGDSPGTESPG
jgi:transcription antitermination factor NusG